MVNYNAGQIYKIWSPSHPEAGIYYGSTCQTLSNRIGGHRRQYKYYLKGSNIFIASFNIVKYEDHKYERVCYFPCNSKKELERAEGKYIKDDGSSCNKNIAGRTHEEYIVECEDRVKKSQKKYSEKNKDRKKEYLENNKERIYKTQKIYYEKNKERGKKYSKIYRENNKEKIRNYKKEKNKCVCGSNFSKYYKKEHEKSQKHIKFINSQHLTIVNTMNKSLS
jgi:hypothetical protein